MRVTRHRMTGIIADDLTGALDGGLQLWKAGRRVSVYLPGGDIDDTQDAVIVLDTESRNSSETEARTRAADAAARLNVLGAPLTYKKIDSTLRGHPGAELEVILEGMAFEAALVAPALPRLGRTVHDGVLLLNNVPLADTEFAADPLSPVASSSVLDILAAGSRLPVRGISVENLAAAANDPDLFFAFAESAGGPSIIVADGETEDDLRTAARLIGGLRGRVLPCGSAGLLEFLSSGVGPRVAEPSRTEPPRRAPRTSSPEQVVVVSSSMSSTTKTQIDGFVRNGAVRISPDRVSLFSGESAAAMAERHVLQGLEALRAGKDVVMDAGGRHGDLPADHETASRQSMIIQEYLEESLSRLVQGVRSGPSIGLVVAGGETALSVCRALLVQGIDLCGEVEPFVPAGRIVGGVVDGLEIVTKAGGFGTVAVMDRAKEFLTRTSEEPMG